MISKNMPCWCGSGKKYKHCHEEWDNTINVLKLQGQQVPSHNLIKSPDDIKWIKKAAKINNEILDLVENPRKLAWEFRENCYLIIIFIY